MSVTVARAAAIHEPWLAKADVWVDEAWVKRCTSLGEYLVAEKDGAPLGFLRWSRFWGTVPYMDMIWVDPAHRGGGIGAKLLAQWLGEVAADGASIAMTSCEADAGATLEWYRKNGFERVGDVMFPTIQECNEVFLAKQV